MSNKNVTFRLINYRQQGEVAGGIHVGLELGEQIISLDTLAAYQPAAQRLLKICAASELTPGIQGLLTNWEQSFETLCELAAFVTRQGVENGPWRDDLVSLEDV